MWAAVKVLCDVNGLEFESVKSDIIAVHADAGELSARMVMDDDDGLHRVIGVKWHKEKEVNAGWALETQRADSHTDRVTHHALQVADEPDEDGNDVYNIFELFKPDHNRHRPFESEDGSVVAVQEGEEER